MNVLQFLDSPELTPGTFEGDSWEPWRAVLSGAFAIPMNKKRRELFSDLSGGRKPPKERVAELIVIAGRRSAKTNTTAGVAVYLATVGVAMEGLAEKLKPGERGVVSCIAVDRSQAKVLFSYIAGIFDESPVLSGMVEKRNAESIELNNRITIEVATNSFRTVRGKTRIAALLDEACFFADENSSTPDVELYRALTPSLATTGGMLIVISSPWAKRGLVYRKWQKHYGEDSADVLVIQGATEQFNPTIDKRILENAKQDDSESYQSEWGGQFRNDISAFIDRDSIERLCRPEPMELPRSQKQRFYYGFVDPTGGGQSANADEFTCCIGHVEQGVVVVDCLRALRGRPADIIKEYSILLRSYGISEVSGDKYAGYFAHDEFEKYGIRYNFTDERRTGLYQFALGVINSGACELPPCEKMVNQFCNLERRVSRSGTEQIDHGTAKGSHDDRANAIAGLIYTARRVNAPPTPIKVNWAR